MQNKLHTTICHAEPSLRVTKCIEKSKFTNLQIFLFSILYTLFSTPATAQQYNWAWAVSGGSPNGNESSSTGMLYNSEQIYDVKTGSDGNYYFIATIKGLNLTQLNGQPVTTYNGSLGGNDIFLFSTTCDGTVRWSQAIGGGENDFAYNLALDSNNNVYVGALLRGGSTYSLHFSPNPAHDVTPFPANLEAYKRIYLVKYDSNGQFIAKKALQGTVTQANREAQITDIVIKNDTIHFIAALLNGTHLDGNVTVPSNFQYIAGSGYTMQFHLVQYDTDLNYVNSIVLPISSDSSFPFTGSIRFAYDENSNIYYLAGMRSVYNNPPIPFTYDGDAFVERSFILAFNGIGSTTGTDGGEVWRREIYSQTGGSNSIADDNIITSLLIDTDSNVYIAGRLWANEVIGTPETIKIYDPSNTQVAPYIFTPGVDYKIPTVIKFGYNNNDISVQWVKTPTAYAANRTTGTYTEVKGLAVRGNEIALGAGTAYFIWDNFVQNPAQFWRPDPALMRFDRQTGNTVGMHTIESPQDYSGYVTAVAVDKDGNYVTGGAFQAVLFTNNANVNQLVSSGGNDFFVAKLAASVCGTPVSTDKFNKLNINVYPNPTNDIVNIETQETLHNYEVYNVLGQQIQKGMFGSNNQINLHGATAGTYFIKITTTQGSTATVKVIKK